MSGVAPINTIFNTPDHPFDAFPEDEMEDAIVRDACDDDRRESDDGGTEPRLRYGRHGNLG